MACPIYNEERYIGECIESVLEQDYPKEDMEVLFVDGDEHGQDEGNCGGICETFPFYPVIGQSKADCSSCFKYWHPGGKR